MLDELTVRKVEPKEHYLIRSVYDASDYRGGIHDEDVGFLASLRNEPVAAVRLTIEHGVMLLRGMMVKPQYQRKGIGKAMISMLDTQIADRVCYLIGREHLQEFYGSIGFVTVDPSEAPPFLVERMKKYNKEWYTCIIMRRAKNPAES